MNISIRVWTFGSHYAFDGASLSLDFSSSWPIGVSYFATEWSSRWLTSSSSSENFTQN